ncbi:MAG: tRNA uridine-5-carboxymethylaminomethyl(34) synthesis GTPase MnmE [Yoonia sp.]|nr:tRNA uridine-5-carboxymethylaminomethyl(34) synthesis GTPase MnmE [Yoonia sp.]
MDTIFALATAQGRAGVAVIRISGDSAFKAASRLMNSLPDRRGVRTLFDQDGVHLDEALVLVFRDGQSFTGEPVVELHLHGSIAVVGAVLRVLGENSNLRPAEAGEFTRRALENGRLDLTQVEGLADLIDAETEGQRKQALRVLSGALGDLAEGWRAKLLRAAALIEATIDFADEEVPVDVSPEVLTLLSEVKVDLARESRGVQFAERLRQGFEVAIVGAPNAGKSTLLNRLAGRDAAITSEIAGTTRDVIEVKMDLHGLPVTVLDTAGLRETDDVVEEIGVKRAMERAAGADIRVYLLMPDDIVEIPLNEDDLVLRAKSDVFEGAQQGISGKTGDGVDALVAHLTAVLSNRVAAVGVAMRERHKLAMLKSLGFLNLAQDAMESGDFMADLVAEDVRSATRAVDSLVGRIDVEEVLGEIFSSFCIGK